MLQPAADGGTQRVIARSGRVGRQSAQMLCQRFLDEGGRRMLGLTDAQTDRAIRSLGRDIGEQTPEFFKRIGLKFFQ